MLSTIALSLENPLEDPNSDLRSYLFYVDIVFTGIFFFELALKVVVFGFALNGSESYIRNSWNVLDFTIVVVSVSLPP
jgi:hypothetical protein